MAYQYKMLDVYYLFQATNISGAALKQRRVETRGIENYLLNVHGLPEDQISNALSVTQKTPGVPYDLHKADDKGNFLWSARLTFVVRYMGDVEHYD